MNRLIFCIIALVLWVSAPAMASQGSGCLPTSGTVSGLTLVQDINAGIAALISSNSGATAPVTDCSAVSIKGQFWLDTSVTPNHLRMYDGANWLDLGAVDGASHLWKPPIGGGTNSLASATTVDLCSVPDGYISITGSTTITGFSNTCAAGTIKALSFVTTPQVTYNATSLILPGATTITAQAGDSAIALYLGGGNWKIIAWSRADGTAISASSVFTGAVFFNSPITVTLGTSTNDWNPSGLATGNVIRLTASSAINLTGLTAPATDGKIIVIDNVGATNNFIVTSQDASSSAANRFAFDRPITVRPGRSITVKYDVTSARWRLIQEVTAQPIMGGFKNLRVFNVATAFSGDTAPTTPNVQMKLAADEITLEDVNGGAVRLSSYACTMDISGNSFSAGTGGLDTGSATAGNWYSEWAIYNPTTNTVSCLGSLQPNAFGSSNITLPSGYTFVARVGWNRYLTNNSVTGFQRLIQYGNGARYAATVSTPTPSLPVLSTNASAGSPTGPTWVGLSVTSVVPSTASRIHLSVGIYNGAIIAAPNNSSSWAAYNATALNSASPPIIINSGNPNYFGGSFNLESGNIYYATAASAALVAVYGWDDNL